MARKRKPVAENTDSRRIPADEKIARLLAMLLVRDAKKKADQVPLLRAAGFEVSEVADMLGMTENNVRVADHRAKKRK
jgi:DNA-directed RNA polymerase specialized sigma24 family protein